MTYAVRDATDADHAWIVGAARETLGSERQVQLRRRFDVTDADVLIVERDGRPVGFLTWEVDGDVCEALAIGVTERGAGAGTELMRVVGERAARLGCRAMRVVTTDANTGAQRFYERLGYRVAEVRPGAVDECRRLYKPEIPADMHDEIEYVRPLD